MPHRVSVNIVKKLNVQESPLGSSSAKQNGYLMTLCNASSQKNKLCIVIEVSSKFASAGVVKLC